MQNIDILQPSLGMGARLTRILLGKHQNSLGDPPCQEASPVLGHNNPNTFGQVRQKGYTILFGCFSLFKKLILHK